MGVLSRRHTHSQVKQARPPPPSKDKIFMLDESSGEYYIGKEHISLHYYLLPYGKQLKTGTLPASQHSLPDLLYFEINPPSDENT